MSNSVVESVEIPIEAPKEETNKSGDSFGIAIEKLGETLFEKYPNKTSNLSAENILGIIRCEALNDFMLEKYGFRYTTLDVITQWKMELVLSHNAMGIAAFNDLVKSIQASFQQTEVPATGILNRIMRR